MNQSANVASPCVRNCCLNQKDICLGCFRSLEEIINWSAASNSERQHIIKLTEMRKTSRSIP